MFLSLIKKKKIIRAGLGRVEGLTVFWDVEVFLVQCDGHIPRYLQVPYFFIRIQILSQLKSHK